MLLVATRIQQHDRFNSSPMTKGSVSLATDTCGTHTSNLTILIRSVCTHYQLTHIHTWEECFGEPVRLLKVLLVAVEPIEQIAIGKRMLVKNVVNDAAL